MIEKLAADTLNLLINAGCISDMEHNEQARAIILLALQMAYRRGDTHGMNNPHRGEDMGR